MIQKQAADMVSEEITRRELSRARKLTKARLARKLHLARKEVSVIERSTDLHLSTLRRTIEGMGGTLSLIAQFPDQPPVHLATVSAEE